MYYQQLYQQQAAAAGQPGANTAQGKETSLSREYCKNKTSNNTATEQQ
jgi:hypothetical protein